MPQVNLSPACVRENILLIDVILFAASFSSRTDFGIAALTGFASGFTEMILGMLGAGVLTDISVGTVTGAIAGFFYRYGGEDICISSIFLGTLYWYCAY